ncbi:MAG: LuxR C-terminal-related transcriptional regulator [Methylibium sp.]|nr:LuxR C-terminal-related transcriptional regulator [Methylibium sp.]
MASALCVSRDTVKFHVRNIYSKLGVKTRLEAIRIVKTAETASR